VELPGWFLDVWMTQVYGRRLSRRLKHVMIEHTFRHCVRYKHPYPVGRDINAVRELCKSLVKAGHQRIAEYLRNTGARAEDLESFQSDDISFDVVYD